MAPPLRAAPEVSWYRPWGQGRHVKRGVLAKAEDERLVWRPVAVKAGGVVAAERNPDLVACPDQRGHRQELHGKGEVLPGRDRQAVSSGEAPGHPEPRGLGRSGRR